MVSTLLTFANGGAKGLRAKSTSTFGVPVAPALRSVGTAGQHSDQRASTLLAAELGLFDWVFVLSFGQSAWEMRPSSDQEAWEKPGKRHSYHLPARYHGPETWSNMYVRKRAVQEPFLHISEPLGLQV